MKFEVDNGCAVKIHGIYKDIRYELSAHNFKDEIRYGHDFRCMWATYVLLSEEQYSKFMVRLDDAPWNGGITFRQKITHEHLDCPPEHKEKWNKPFYKVGDDFSHLWDLENCGWDESDRPHMENHIKRVIDYLVG